MRDAEKRRLGAIWSALWPGAVGLGIALGAAVLGISYEHVMMGATSVKVAVYVGLAVVVACAAVATLRRRLRPSVESRALTITADGIAFRPPGGAPIGIPWPAITRVLFTRKLERLPVPLGDCEQDAEWTLALDDGRVVAIRYGLYDDAALIQELRAHLPAFDSTVLETVFVVRDVGRWTIWQRSPEA